MCVCVKDVYANGWMLHACVVLSVTGCDAGTKYLVGNDLTMADLVLASSLIMWWVCLHV